jgi:hypothetical protein
LLGVLCLIPTPQIRDAVNVYIDADAFVAAPRSAQREVCHFGADSGERYKTVNCVGDIGIELVAQDLGGLLDVFGFEVVETDFVDEAVEFGGFEGKDGFKIKALNVLAITGT